MLATSKIGRFRPKIARYLIGITQSPKIELHLDRLPQEVLPICLGSTPFVVRTMRYTHIVVMVVLLFFVCCVLDKKWRDEKSYQNFDTIF